MKKRDALVAAGFDVYPATVSRTHTIAAVIAEFIAFAESRITITVVGRIVGMRGHGGVFFLDIQDASGVLQVVAKKDTLQQFELLRDNLDLGDYVGVTGTLFTTQKGEQSIESTILVVLAKSLRPLPSDWYGFSDVETRLRKRYLDLLAHPDIREQFRKKAQFWNSVRQLLIKKGFLEVETPVLEAIPGGADARPFTTHHHALDIDLYLRISPELHLKRLLVGGYERVFEIGRVFRNEGIDAEHLQDYTEMEFYVAYADYRFLQQFVPKMFRHIIKATCGTLTTTYHGQEIFWGKPWKKVDYCKAFRKATGLTITKATVADLIACATRFGIPAMAQFDKGRLVDLIYKKIIRPNLIQPTLLINHPVEISPLAKRRRRNPATVERIQVVACGSELGNGWSELNDPGDQRARFEEQAKLRAAGDDEAQMMDEDFVEALEYGMPPAAGFGISERLFAILMDKPVRECVFFPLMKPRL